jgi:hypothetical protein
MGLFDIFKKSRQNAAVNTDNGVPGPTYLEKVTAHISNPQKLEAYEWRRHLVVNC